MVYVTWQIKCYLTTIFFRLIGTSVQALYRGATCRRRRILHSDALLGDITPIVSLVNLGPVREDVKNMPLFRINQDELDTLVSVGGSVAFEFVNEKFLQKLGERRIIVGI